MKAIALDHLNFTVKNLSESIDWYRKVFGFRVVETGRRYRSDGIDWAILQVGDFTLCISESQDRLNLQDSPDTEEKFHRFYHFALRIEDKAEWLKTAEEHRLRFAYGGEIAYPHSTSWYVADPTGHEIEVVLWNRGTPEFVAAGV